MIDVDEKELIRRAHFLQGLSMRRIARERRHSRHTVRRALEDAYFGGKTLSYQDIRVWAMEYFGPYAGYAQQYLFHGKRLGKGGANRNPTSDDS